MVVMYQGVIRYPTHRPEHVDTNSSKAMRHFWQTTHYYSSINRPTCTLIRVFLSNKVLRALWPVMMEYLATDLSGYVPLLVGPANYKPIGMNSSFDFLEVSVNQCSMYGCICTRQMVMSYPSHSYRRTNGHTDSWVTGSHKLLHIFHSCIPIWK